MTSAQNTEAAIDTAVEKRTGGARSGRVSLIIAVLVASLTVASAIAFAGAKRRPAGDVWLGLAAGRLILERGYTDFPVADEFTWTFAGKTWYNQNWLSHVILYWTYDRLFPAAIVGLSLICLLIIAVCLILTTRVLCGETMLGALLVAIGLVAGCILWQIRPDTATRICACLTLLVLVLTTYRHALWGLAVLPLLLFWSNAHGGFLLGYAMVGAWLAGDIAERIRRREQPMALAAVAVLGGATVASIPLAAWLSPFGWENFTHPLLVMGSPVFQGVWEWQSPLFPRSPTSEIPDLIWIRRILIMASITYGVLTIGGFLVRDWATFRLQQAKIRTRDAELSGCGRGISLSELAIVALVTYFALKHIRFTPLFYTLPVPILCKFLAIRGRQAAMAWRASATIPGRRHVRTALSLIALVLTGLLLTFGRDYITAGYIDPLGRPWREGLLGNQLQDWSEPGWVTNFARANGLTGRLYTKWKWGGYVMFFWPDAKVFIDGRSQALFDEKMYKHYQELNRLSPPEALPPAQRGRQVDEALRHPDVPTGLGAEMVLLRRDAKTLADWIGPLLATGDWIPACWGAVDVLLIRRDAASPGLPEAIERFDQLALNWPDDEWGLASRATAALFLPEPDFNGAFASFRAAIDLAPCAPLLESFLACAVRAERGGEALRVLQDQTTRLAGDRCGLTEAEHTESVRTIRVLTERFSFLSNAGSSQPANQR